MNAGLVAKNVTIGDRRTSLRLEPEIWEALDEICRREGLTVHQLCTLIDDHRHGSSRTSAVRAFTIGYFHVAATEAGHGRAGHGRLPRGTGMGGAGRRPKASASERAVRSAIEALARGSRKRQVPV